MNIAYAYPWDIVGDPAAPERLAALGVDAVALAASYHSTRAATPRHPGHRVLDVPHSAFYLPVRPEAWGRLVPAAPTWTTPDAYLLASEELRAAGLKVYAWTVLTHNAHLGQAHPDLVVRNAFGDRYPYALCPSWEDVADYCERLVREVLTAGEPDGLILEGCGAMGFGHQSVHEKTAGADFDADLMSLCFCARCADRYPAGTRERVQAAIDTGSAPQPAPAARTPARLQEPHRALTVGTGSGALEAALGPLADEVGAVRVELSASLRRLLTATARQVAPDVPITLHADPNPWATGPFAALPEGEQAADVLVGNCWGDPAKDAARLSRLGELCAPGQRVGAYVLALPPRPADAQALAELLRTYVKAGASEIHLYHAGLASPQRLTAMADALRLANL
ncbi:hypothetical protein ACTMTF_10945 [Nonomuraea sp. ZG12]|uniref:hypothetical protein n=1 Tax=Nonomuraea sp. ZG12 TaxID=3452207 RepID=UPI003F894C42